MGLDNEAVALIPAYKPDHKLIALLKEIKANAGFIVVVINDGSPACSDQIFIEAERYSKVLHHTANMGKGTAIKTGLAYIQKNFADNAIVITMDADGQHKVPDAIRVFKTALSNSESLVIGSRVFAGKVPLRSRFGNSVTRFVYKTVTGIKVKDTQTGLRAFSASLIPFMLGISGSRYEYEMNVLLECSRQKIDIKQVQIETVYINDNQSSHFKPIKDSYRIYKEIIKFGASSFIAFLVDYGLYSLMIFVTKGLTVALSLQISNISARVVSSGLNFYINRKYVFKNSDGIVIAALKYFALAGVILFANTFLLDILVQKAGIERHISKLLVEVSFFIISWLVQRLFIFKRGKGGDASGSARN